jgi:hypothetical protein
VSTAKTSIRTMGVLGALPKGSWDVRGVGVVHRRSDGRRRYCRRDSRRQLNGAPIRAAGLRRAREVFILKKPRRAFGRRLEDGNGRCA